jgi:sugar/nucleoside kinase (ribokinase family)
LANSLAILGHKVSLVTSVGNDQDGWNLLSNLVTQGVDVKNVSVEDAKKTNETILIDEKKGTRGFIGVSQESALSITTPSQVPWSKLEKTKVVYIGEVFIEVASTICAFAKSNKIPVVYRCSVPFLERGLEQLKLVLEQADILILSNPAWKYLKSTIRKDPIAVLRSYTEAAIAVRNSSTVYTIYIKDEKTITISTKSDVVDITGDFSAHLLIGLSEDLSSTDAITKAIQLERN